MNIVELINHVGESNVGIQLLPQCLLDARIVNERGEITFVTDADKALEQATHSENFLGVILWIPVTGKIVISDEPIDPAPNNSTQTDGVQNS